MAGRPKVAIKNRHNSSKKESAASHKRARAMETNRVRTLDNLRLHDELFHGIIGPLKQDIANGMGALEIAKKYANLAQARTVTIALTEPDSSKALAAAKDIIDRSEGKAIERKQIAHALASASEQELDAVIASKLAILESAEDEKEGE
jgi:hypothetical protein